jgi:four helix bundle protein
MHNFKELKVWKKAIDFVVEVYTISDKFPEKENFGITSQLRRAAVSVSCNISEGAAKSPNKDFNRFLEMAIGSANEVENLIIICNRLRYIKDEDSNIAIDKIHEIGKMIVGFQKTLKSDI